MNLQCVREWIMLLMLWGWSVGLAVPDTVEQQAAILLKLVRGLTETATSALQSRSWQSSAQIRKSRA